MKTTTDGRKKKVHLFKVVFENARVSHMIVLANNTFNARRKLDDQLQHTDDKYDSELVEQREYIGDHDIIIK